MSPIDKAYEIFKSKFQELLNFSLEPISESDTRCKIIDVIFKDVLGWIENDIERERFVQVGYYDYEISTSIFRFVVEAKKTFSEFIIPEKTRKVKLKTIYKGNKEVIDQIRNYIFHRGLLYGIITNGKQFIIGKFHNTDGKDWQENEVLVFQSLDVIDSDFIYFYETLSKEFVNFYGRFKLFSETNVGNTIVRSVNLHRKEDELIRNKISHELIPIITEVFEEIYNLENLKDEKILQQCYVKNDDVKKYNSELGFIFSDQPPTFDSRINPVQNTDKTHDQLKDEIICPIKKLPDPVIIIGGTGVGKTTFLKYFLEVVLDKGTKKNRPLLYLDFRNETESTIKDTKSIYQKLLNQLYQDYSILNLNNFNILKIIYKVEIENQKSAFWSHLKDEIQLSEKISEFLQKQSEDPILHLTKISNYLIHQCHKRLCIIIDNADQLKEDIQKEVFILGHSLHRNLKVMTIISLREGYFYKLKNKPPFDAYHSTIFHITAPPYREVLKKRIKYVLDNFKFEKIKIPGDYMKVELGEGSLNKLFVNLYKVLFDDANSQILSFLEETSYPNIRNGLEKFKFFLLSGHTKTNLYMSLDYGNEGKGIPMWEFIKSVALESNYYYQIDRSTLLNIFYPSAHNRNHFTKIRLLEYLIDISIGVSKKNKFQSVSLLVNCFAKAGYTSEIILEELNLLYAAGLIFTNDYVSDVDNDDISLDLNNEIGITQSGVYYVKNLINRFYYYDLVLQDTPIYNQKVFDELALIFPESDIHGNRNLAGRKNVVEAFINYLQDQETLDHNRKELNYNVKCLDKQIIKTVVESGLGKDLDRIQKVVVNVQKSEATFFD